MDMQTEMVQTDREKLIEIAEFMNKKFGIYLNDQREVRLLHELFKVKGCKPPTLLVEPSAGDEGDQGESIVYKEWSELESSLDFLQNLGSTFISKITFLELVSFSFVIMFIGFCGILFSR